MHGQERISAQIFLPEVDSTDFDARQGANVFEFHGNARDYFRIWIVNVALSIVTLGVYSAWASVRTRRYMYANTSLAGSPFEYQAEPLPILRGRLLAAAVLGISALAARISAPLQLACIVVIGALMPWFIVKGLMFRARYSAWRGVNFRFAEDYAGAYQRYLLVYLVPALVITLMLGMSIHGHVVIAAVVYLVSLVIFYFFFYPWVKGKQQQWKAEHHYFGGKLFRFSYDPKVYRRIYLGAMGISMLSMLGTSMVLVAVMGSLGWARSEMREHMMTIQILGYLCVAPAYLSIWTYIQVRMTNALYNQTSIGKYQFESTLSWWDLLCMYFLNTLAIIGTLGLAVPWARIRVARYRAQCLRVVGDGKLDDFEQTYRRTQRVSAVGAEVDGLLGFDIGL
jgi:uncharacterized membrane protein YjgN (DUF898 family)